MTNPLLTTTLGSALLLATLGTSLLVGGCNTSGGERRTADGKIIRIADDGTEEICNAAPAGGNRPGVKAVNTVCPVVDADGADENVTAEWRGKTIAFCCPTCVRKFDRMSDAEKDAMLKKATTYAAAP